MRRLASATTEPEAEGWSSLAICLSHQESSVALLWGKAGSWGLEIPVTPEGEVCRGPQATRAGCGYDDPTVKKT